MNRTWFLTEKGQVVRIDHPIEEGSNDEQWRSLIRTTGIRISNDNRKWGAFSKCQLLNWIESKCPDRMPRFFESKSEALDWFEQSKKDSSNEQSNANIEEGDTPDGAA
jgi:hypothetical protein